MQHEIKKVPINRHFSCGRNGARTRYTSLVKNSIFTAMYKCAVNTLFFDICIIILILYIHYVNAYIHAICNTKCNTFFILLLFLYFLFAFPREQYLQRIKEII